MSIEAMKNDRDVRGHIRRINEEAKREMEETPGLWVGLLWEGLADEYETVYDFEKGMALEAYSNAHKAEHGFRDRSIDPDVELEDIHAMTEAL